MPGYYMASKALGVTSKCTLEVCSMTASLDRCTSVCLGGDCGPSCQGQCLEGHTGFLCGHCDHGWTRDTYTESCSKCPPRWNVNLQLVAIAFGLLGSGVMYMFFAVLQASSVASGRPPVHTVTEAPGAEGRVVEFSS